MNSKYPLSSTAALIADPGRAAMLSALLSGTAMPAGELARIAGVSAQSASMHLAQLVQGGFLTLRQQGRYRYYALASPDVAHAIEALGVISTVASPKPRGASQALCYARTCYDHLAGELGVELTAALEGKAIITGRGARDYDLTAGGERFLHKWGIDAAALRQARRCFARRCRDWTERRDHLAGALGAAICQKLLDLRWITRSRNSRAVHLTVSGRMQLSKLFGVPL